MSSPLGRLRPRPHFTDEVAESQEGRRGGKKTAGPYSLQDSLSWSPLSGHSPPCTGAWPRRSQSRYSSGPDLNLAAGDENGDNPLQSWMWSSPGRCRLESTRAPSVCAQLRVSVCSSLRPRCAHPDPSSSSCATGRCSRQGSQSRRSPHAPHCPGCSACITRCAQRLHPQVEELQSRLVGPDA